MLALTAFVVFGLIILLGWKQHGLKLYNTRGNNLAPILNRGDLLLVSPNQPPQTGDLVALADPIDPRGVIAQQFSGQIPADFTGVAVKAIPLAGFALDWLRRPLVLALVIYTPALLLVRAQIPNLRQRVKRQPYRLEFHHPQPI